jgi:hypothetical protein
MTLDSANTVGRSSGDNRFNNIFSLETNVAVGSLALSWLDQFSKSVVIVVDLLPLFPGCFIGLDLG